MNKVKRGSLEIKLSSKVKDRKKSKMTLNELINTNTQVPSRSSESRVKRSADILRDISTQSPIYMGLKTLGYTGLGVAAISLGPNMPIETIIEYSKVAAPILAGIFIAYEINCRERLRLLYYKQIGNLND